MKSLMVQIRIDNFLKLNKLNEAGAEESSDDEYKEAKAKLKHTCNELFRSIVQHERNAANVQ